MYWIDDYALWGVITLRAYPKTGQALLALRAAGVLIAPLVAINRTVVRLRLSAAMDIALGWVLLD